MISEVGSQDVVTVWEALRPAIQKGLQRGAGAAVTEQALLCRVLQGELSMWVVHEGDSYKAVLLFAVVKGQPRRKIWVELLAGTDLEAWYDEIISLLQDYRDVAGADTIEASCRPGLAKSLEGRGWKTKAVVMAL